MVPVTSRARDATDNLPLVRQLGVVLGSSLAVDLEGAQRSVHATAVVLARDRLLPG